MPLMQFWRPSIMKDFWQIHTHITKEKPSQMDNVTIVIETELPVFMLNLAVARGTTQVSTLRTKNIKMEVLDLYADALSRLFRNEFVSSGVTEVVHEEIRQSKIKGYGLRIKESTKNGQPYKIYFFNIKPTLIPAVLDLVSLGLSLLSFAPGAVLPIADSLHNFICALVLLDSSAGDADAIAVYKAYLQARGSLIESSALVMIPSTEQINTFLPNWTKDKLLKALWVLESRSILKPEEDHHDRYAISTRWRECW